MSAAARYSPHPDAAWREVDGQIYAITADRRLAELEGEVELLAWTLCNEAPRTLEDLVAAVTERFDIDTETATTDLRQWLDLMLECGLYQSTI